MAMELTKHSTNSCWALLQNQLFWSHSAGLGFPKLLSMTTKWSPSPLVTFSLWTFNWFFIQHASIEHSFPLNAMVDLLSEGETDTNSDIQWRLSFMQYLSSLRKIFYLGAQCYFSSWLCCARRWTPGQFLDIQTRCYGWYWYLNFLYSACVYIVERKHFVLLQIKPQCTWGYYVFCNTVGCPLVYATNATHSMLQVHKPCILFKNGSFLWGVCMTYIIGPACTSILCSPTVCLLHI